MGEGDENSLPWMWYLHVRVLVHDLQQSPRYALDGREGRSAGGTAWRGIMNSLLNMAASMLVPANLQINILR